MNTRGFFFYAMLCGVSWATLHRIFACAMLSQKYYDNIEQDLSRAVPVGEYCTRCLPMQCCPKSIKTTLSKMFSVQCCRKVLGKHCTRLLPVQCCPKRIKTTLNKLFSCAILPGASRATLSRVFPSAMLFQEY